jgi:hypothetical protein
LDSDLRAPELLDLEEAFEDPALDRDAFDDVDALPPLAELLFFFVEGDAALALCTDVFSAGLARAKAKPAAPTARVLLKTVMRVSYP